MFCLDCIKRTERSLFPNLSRDYRKGDTGYIEAKLKKTKNKTNTQNLKKITAENMNTHPQTESNGGMWSEKLDLFLYYTSY